MGEASRQSGKSIHQPCARRMLSSWLPMVFLDARRAVLQTALGAAVGISLAVGASPAMAFSKPNNKERTYIMIKPDGVQRGLIGDIVKRFEQRGFKLVALKMVTPSVSHLKEHYADLAKKP